MTTVTFDVETTTANRGHPFTPENFAVSYAVKVNNEPTSFHYYNEPDFISYLRGCISKANLLVGFNIKFDIHWLTRLGITLPDDVDVFDCSLAEFIVTGQEAVMVSLDETLASYGLSPKQDKVAEYWSIGMDTPDIPVEVLEEYNIQDVELTYQLFLTQCEITNQKQHTLILLAGKDLLSLASAEYNGIKFDTEKCHRLVGEYSSRMADIQKELDDYIPELPEQCVFNWNSGDSLSALLYGGDVTFEWRTEELATYKSGPKKGDTYLKGSWHSYVQTFPKRFNPLEGTAVKKCLVPGYNGTMYYQVDDPTLKQLKSRKNEDKQLLGLLDNLAKTTKVLEMMETFLKHFKELAWANDMVHGQYNQNIARTGRLSASRPNLQNTSPEIDQLLVSRYM